LGGANELSLEIDVKTSRLAGLITAGAAAGAGLVIVALSVVGCQTGSGCHMMGMAPAAPSSTAATSPGSPAGFVNARCPIMGGKPTEALTRDYNGQKVGFCCAMCPGQWDKLSDADKAARLAKVAVAAK
jgi:hypothetical protein